ncbi:MAG TPA: histidine kinase dimerization/phospho-acceptor domain-containing protein, partial [Alphaproteobacteria bacterium]|nr:histidine kinase dimerization/phospho-acceptor domain-containing protein [Alphaproteobacteria bacterium]
MPKFFRRLLPLIAIILPMTGVLSGLYYIDQLDKERHVQSQRNAVLDRASVIRSRLESTINSTLLLSQSLNTFISIYGDITAEEFQLFAKDMYAKSPISLRILLIRNSSIVDTYPRTGNINLLEKDINNYKNLFPTFSLAKASGNSVLAGPVEMIDGEKSFVAWLPVFLAAEENDLQALTYWGQIAIVIKHSTMLTELRFSDTANELNIGIRGIDGKGATGGVFAGDANVFLENPVTVDISLPSGSWQMAAIPKDGWSFQSPNRATLVGIGVVTSIVVGFLSFFLVFKNQSLRQYVEALSLTTVELRQRDQYLAQRNLLLQVQQDVSIDGIVVIDPKGFVISHNKKIKEIWGFTDGILDGQHVNDIKNAIINLVQVQSTPVITRMAENTFLIQNDQNSFDGEIELKDLRTLEIHTAQLLDKDQKNFGWIWFFRDITARKASEKTIAMARDDAIREREKAQMANRSKSEFLALMSHELRTPLNAIIGFSEIIHKQMFGEISQNRYVTYAQDIYTSGTHLLALINDILDLAKIEAGKMDIYCEWLDVSGISKSCLALVEAMAAKKSLSLSSFIEGGVNKIYADPRAIKQMIVNLLSNACKFTNKNGAVKLEFARATAGDT